MGSKSAVTFKNASDGKQIELEIKGDWMDRSAEITWEGKPVATISRKFFNAREFFGDKQTVSSFLGASGLVRVGTGGISNADVVDTVFRRRGRECGLELDRGHLCVARREGE